MNYKRGNPRHTPKGRQNSTHTLELQVCKQDLPQAGPTWTVGSSMSMGLAVTVCQNTLVCKAAGQSQMKVSCTSTFSGHSATKRSKYSYTHIYVYVQVYIQNISYAYIYTHLYVYLYTHKVCKLCTHISLTSIPNPAIQPPSDMSVRGPWLQGQTFCFFKHRTHHQQRPMCLY